MLLLTISNWLHLVWLTHKRWKKEGKSKVDVHKVRSLYVVFSVLDAIYRLCVWTFVTNYSSLSMQLKAY